MSIADPEAGASGPAGSITAAPPTPLSSLLADLARAGVRLKLADSRRLEVTAPTGRFTAALRDQVAARKQELIEWLATGGPDRRSLPQIQAGRPDASAPFPLADLQTSFLIGSEPGVEYHVRPHQYLELDFADLDPARFEVALNEALRRQRANLVVLQPDLTLAPVRDPAPIRIRVADVRALPEAEAEAAIAGTRAEMCRTELPLDRWPWLDIRISRYGADRVRLHYNNNNFFSDAIGTRRFLDSVLRRCHNPGAPEPELAISYRDCVLALAELEESALGQESKAYWTSRLADLPGSPPVPLATGPAPGTRSQLTRRELTLPPASWAAFRKRAAAHGLTPTGALHAVYAQILMTWSNSRHFLINNMVTHRLPMHAQIDEVIGNLASLYPLEVDWREDKPFCDRARRLQGQLMTDLEHVYWSGAKVLQALNQARLTPGRAVCPFVTGSALGVAVMDRPVFSLLETPQVLLDCELFELRDGALWVVWDVIEAMFPAGLIDAMHDGYRRLVHLLADSDQAWRQASFDLLPAAQLERRALVNRTSKPIPDRRLHDRLPELAATCPGRTALISPRATLTYEGLHGLAAGMTHRLRELGTLPGDLVAVTAPKGWEQVAAVFGVLAAGAAYVPIDPDWPAERVRYLLRDAAPRAIITTPELRASLTELAGDLPVLADWAPTGAPPIPPGARGQGSSETTPLDRAYVIYTSGTTGRPKGTVLDHRGPLNTITDINQRFGIGPADVVLGLSSLCFDLSAYDIFGAVAAGAALVLPDPRQSDPAAWLQLALEHQVSVWNSVPALMRLLVDEATGADVRLPALRTVLLSGDWIPVGLPARIRAIAPNARVISLGGATEASIWSICYPVDHDDPAWTSIPYGRPLANQTWKILDDFGHDVPDWVPGELHIGGIGLAREYLNDPDRTGSAFVTHPGIAQRLYRTGDLGRYLPSGDIEFLGRTDFQVKIQGFRVEPGEIEHALTEHPSVRQAVVVARKAGSGMQLIGYAVATGGRERPDETALLRFLADRLPGYLVPDQITVLDQLPLTENGKLDRNALQVTASAGPQPRPYRAPRNPIESELARIWESVLSVSPVGVDDQFFDLGGQSFAALRVISLIARRWGHRLPLSALMERPTIARLAELICAPDVVSSPLVTLRDDGEGTPWFLVHPAGGGIEGYRALADLLDSPCYAFEATMAAGWANLGDSVEDIAGSYLPRLLAARPTGPYRIGGWSSGAVVAFELARQLESAGEQVAALTVIDAPAPTGPSEVDEASLLLWFLEDLDRGFEPAGVADADLAELTAAAGPDRMAAALRLGSRYGLDDTGIDSASLTPAYEVFQKMIRATHQYRPVPITAGITVVRAEAGQVTEFASYPGADRDDWGWAALTSGPTVAARVAGASHHTLLGKRHVAATAGAMRRSGSPGPGRTGN